MKTKKGSALNYRTLLSHRQIQIIIKRLAAQIIEHTDHSTDLAIIGLQPRGILFSQRILEEIQLQHPGLKIKYGELDATFHRDDLRRGEIIVPNENKIDFLVENTHVIIIDDVLYTGRSVRAALDALNAYGRPLKVELMVLVDRRYSRELPISPDYTGIEIDTRANDKVKVLWDEQHTNDEVIIKTQN